MQFRIQTLLIAIVAFALLSWAYSLLFLHGPRHSARVTCRNNIRHICLALLNYEFSLGHLPLASETGPDGLKWHSWKSTICPSYFETSRSDYDRTQPWDSPVNRAVVAACSYPSVFCCPVGSNSAIDYSVIVGRETAFPIDRETKLSDITDGIENTILVVEAVGISASWTEPKDLEFDSMSFRINDKNQPGISSHHRHGAYVGFADGSCYFVTDKISESELRALITIAGGESVTRKDLIDRGILR